MFCCKVLICLIVGAVLDFVGVLRKYMVFVLLFFWNFLVLSFEIRVVLDVLDKGLWIAIVLRFGYSFRKFVWG